MVNTNSDLISPFCRKGGMRFTEDRARLDYAGRAVHTILQPQRIQALGEILAGRMRRLNGGRLWMGAHVRRGDCE